MAHFAELGPDNTVVRVVVVANACCLDADGKESESVGRKFCEQLFGGRWVQTSYNGKKRLRFAARGYRYDPARDAFVRPRPYPSWKLNASTLEWEPPVPRPAGQMVSWDEAAKKWVQFPAMAPRA